MKTDLPSIALAAIHLTAPVVSGACVGGTGDHEPLGHLTAHLGTPATARSNPVPDGAITLDGDPGDWAELIDFGADPDDVPAAGEQVDWRRVALAHDADELFLSYRNDVAVSAFHGGFLAFLDTDGDPGTGYRGGDGEFPIGADYLIQAAELYVYTGSGTNWSWSLQTTLSSSFTPGASFIEMSLPLDQIGDPAQIDLFFLGDNTSSGDTEPDYYPDGAVTAGAYFRYSVSGNLWMSDDSKAPPFHIHSDGDGDMSVRFVDVNGDGRLDLLYHRWFNYNIQKGAYLNTDAGWLWAPQFTPPFHIIGNGRDMSVRFVDVNGDGRLDLIYHRDFSGNRQKGAYLNTSTGWQSAPEFTPPFLIHSDNAGDMGVRFVDVNGDGRLDLVYHRQFGSNVQKGAYLATDTGWLSAPQFTPPFHIIRNNIDAGVRFVDVNGDGRLDLLHHGVIGGNVQKGAYLNTSTGWQPAPQLTPPFLISSDTAGDMGVRFVDVNGDGRLDFVYHRWFPAPGTPQKGAYLNTNAGWLFAPQLTPPYHITGSVSGGGADLSVRFVDVNGDSRLDLLYHRTFGSTIQKGAYLNLNAGWQQAKSYSPPFNIIGNGRDMGVRFVDVNGDGSLDFLYHRYFSGNVQQGAYLNPAGSVGAPPAKVCGGVETSTSVSTADCR